MHEFWLCKGWWLICSCTYLSVPEGSWCEYGTRLSVSSGAWSLAASIYYHALEHWITAHIDRYSKWLSIIFDYPLTSHQIGFEWWCISTDIDQMSNLRGPWMMSGLCTLVNPLVKLDTSAIFLRALLLSPVLECLDSTFLDNCFPFLGEMGICLPN